MLSDVRNVRLERVQTWRATPKAVLSAVEGQSLVAAVVIPEAITTSHT